MTCSTCTQPAATFTADEARVFSSGLTIAKRAVVADIETNGVLVATDEPGRWYDTRPMLDLREHSPEMVDMLTEALAFAVDTGLARTHSALPHLVRITSAGGAT